MEKSTKGISLIALIITIVIITILAAVMIPSGIDKINNAKVASFNSDILTLKQEIDSYIALNSLEYPVKTNASGEYIVYSINTAPTLLAEATKKNDQNDIFYIVDLQKIEINNVNQGAGASVDDYYIVARVSRNVYYAKGIEIGNMVYHTKQNKGDNVVEVLPTSAPTPTPSYAYNNPVVPTGFTYVGNEAWDNGYTIQDSNANQFVWVPALDPRVQENGTLDNTNFNRKFGRRNFMGNTFDSSNYYETNDTTLQNMTSSVNKYGGFYIAKYEASNNGSGKAQSKANVDSWGNIDWSTAKAKAECMDSDWGWNTSAVESYLCYGAHWDTTLQWLVNSGNKTLVDISGNSINWGNYLDATFTYGASSTVKATFSGVKINTGISTTPANRHMAKGIYDLAGNTFEWTMENSTTSGYTCRGGYYFNFGNNTPAAHRMGYISTYSTGDVSWRSVLYIP